MSAPAPTAVTLRVLPGRLAVCCLPGWRALPDWLDWTAPLVSVTRRDGELSVICPETQVPSDADDPALAIERGWRALAVDGPLEFALVGLLADLAGRLAGAGVSLVALSTFETDLILVRAAALPRALAALRTAHTVIDEIGPD